MEGMKIHAVTKVSISRTDTGIIWNTSSGLFPCTDKVTKGISKHCNNKRNESREKNKFSDNGQRLNMRLTPSSSI
jgi:hypothetical protein